MPRNGSGVYTAPASTSFNPATTSGQATAPDWNALLADLVNALSTSVASDGQTTITQNIPFNSNRLTGVANPVGNQDAATKAYVDASQRSYLAGLTLSNDSGTPNTVLDIAAGFSVDSTNTVGMASSAFTKSTGGAWSAGTGQNGMGQGLTIANSTWYHVFQAMISGSVDFFFDTSATAANKPTGTTAFRRIGSFVTDGSAHIVSFIQDGDDFQLKTLDGTVTATNPGTSAVSKTLPVPTGVRVKARFQFILQNNGSVSGTTAYLSDLSTTDSTPTQGSNPIGDMTDTVTASGGAGQTNARFEIWTNTSAQIRVRLSFSDGNVGYTLNTLGWIDRRGRDA